MAPLVIGSFFSSTTPANLLVDSFFRYSLAYAELYITIANFVRRFDMDLYDTTIENIRPVREYGLGHPKDGTFSVRAKVTKVVQE